MNIKFLHVGVATCILDIDGKVKIGIDPALAPLNHKIVFKTFDSVRIKSPKYQETTFKDIDIWLITHPHEDHIDSFGKEVISSVSTVICDNNTKNSTILNDKKLNILQWGEDYLFSKADYSIKITAIPAYHGNSWISRTLVGKVNGYLLEISDSFCKKYIYFTGDTVYHKNILQRLPNKIDILIANLGNVRSENLGGPLTMNLEMLNFFIRNLNPDKVIPIHIDDFSHYETSRIDVQQAGIAVIPVGKWITL